MRKRILSIIILIFIITDFFFYKINVHFGNKQHFSIIYFLLSSLLIFLIIEYLIYYKLFNLKSNKFKIIIFIICPLIISMIVSDRLQAINKFYFSSKRLILRDYNLWKSDNILGIKSVPNSQCSFNYYIGDSIKGSVPVLFDSIGYRTVPDFLKLKNDILDLYLGCSFTFGDFIEAQNSYPYLTSKFLNHNYINASASGYGLGQMVQLLENLTKKYHFKYVFIQLSPWLAYRAMDLNGPVRDGYRPFPYYSDHDNSFKLNLPAFSILKYSYGNWRDTKPSYYERIQFIFTDGVITEICDYFFYQIARLKTYLGFLPKPTERKEELERYFYDYAINVCEKNNTIPIILKICTPWYSPNQCNDLLDYLRPKAKIIDLDFNLAQKVRETGMDYKKLYFLNVIHNKYVFYYDSHPNEYANKLFSDRICNELKNE
jgi:hypothetical protein